MQRLEGRLKIDKYDLDGELVDAAVYYNEIAQNYADAVSYRDEAKAEVDGIRAKLDQAIRKQLAAANEKTTEDGLKAKITAHPEYQAALEQLAAWNDRVVRWTGLQEAVKQRGYALKDLASLYVAGYWADQAGSTRAAREVKHEVAEEARERIAEKARSRRKLPEDA